MAEVTGTNSQEKNGKIRLKPVVKGSPVRKSASRIFRSADHRYKNNLNTNTGLQRTCSCGQHTIGGGECNSCRMKGSLGNNRSEYEREVGGENSTGFTTPVIQRYQSDFNPINANSIRSNNVTSQIKGGEGTGEDDPEAIVGAELRSYRNIAPLPLWPLAQREDDEKADAKLKYSTKSAPKALDCGGFHSQIKWDLDGSNEKTTGFVVQKVTFKLKRKNCSDEDNNFIKTYWEAWQVREGKIYIGTSDSPHGSDTFRVPPKPDHKGINYEAGDAKFMPNYEAPKTWGNVPQALSLPSTASKPEGWSDAGTLSRYMRNTFNCCDGATESKFESEG